MFKDLFVQLLQERDITAYKLAKDTNLSEALISNWKSGRQLPKYDSIKILCNYFNVSADYDNRLTVISYLLLLYTYVFNLSTANFRFL